MMEKFLLKEETYKIIGICMEVHNNLGAGFLEAVYKDALEYEFLKNNILFFREQNYKVAYKDIILPHSYTADFVVFDKIIIEVKAVKTIINEHIAQTINYLKVSENKVGLLINFGESKLKYQRLIY